MDRTNIGYILLLSTLLMSCIMGDVKVMNFTQKLDHFNIRDDMRNFTFQQRFLMDDSRWSGAESGGPIIAMLGNEREQTEVPERYGIMNLSAFELKAMVIHIEHRFYGDSIPLGSIETALVHAGVRECFTTSQALEDFAVIIQSLRTNLSALNSPVIVVGLSYGGALATWFRLKYPEIAIGALASSTPLLYYGNSTPGDGYCSVVSNTYQTINPKCHEYIRQSWKLIDELASHPNGLINISKMFVTCRPFQSSYEVRQWLGQFYSGIAGYDDYRNIEVEIACEMINYMNGSIEGIANAFLNDWGEGECFEAEEVSIKVNSPFEPTSNITMGWAWQRCTELIYPVGCGTNSMLLPYQPFDYTQFLKNCRSRFGEVPFPHSPISVFGTHDIKKSLQFGGNIIFSNGLMDPSSSGGILSDVSSTIVALNNEKGAWCRDFSTQTDQDPKWLRKLREEEIKIFKHWINHYHHINKGSDFNGCSLYMFLLELFIFLLL